MGILFNPAPQLTTNPSGFQSDFSLPIIAADLSMRTDCTFHPAFAPYAFTLEQSWRSGYFSRPFTYMIVLMAAIVAYAILLRKR
jgi:hypothetical protein